MKNKVRIIAAAVLTLFVLFSMSIPSFAVDGGSITINNTNEAVSMKGHTYRAYKIFDVVYDATSGNYDYTIAAPFGTYFDSKNLPENSGADKDARAYAFVAGKTGADELQAFAREIYASLGDHPENYAAGSVTATSANTAVIDELGPGYYLVYDEGTNNSDAPAPEKAIANIALTTAAPDATIDLKASVPTIDKKITAVSDSATNAATTDNGSDGVSANLGQHVGFQIDSIVPDLTGYSNYIYKVKDTMDAGLTPDNNAKVTIKGADVTNNEKCHITYDGQVMTVTIDFELLKEYDKDDPIVITYSAKVNANANVYPAADGTGNQAELEYSNNVTNDTITEKTPTSTVKVYRFTLEITKVNSKQEALQGAEFVLKDDAGTPIPVALTEGRYKVSDTLEATEANATVVSNASGKIFIDGLAEGHYTLTETVAPANYNLLKDDVDVNITATYDSEGDVETLSGDKVTVINKAGGILPSTGGIGTWLFIFGGASLMLAAAFVLITRKQKAEVK